MHLRHVVCLAVRVSSAADFTYGALLSCDPLEV